MQPSNWNDFRYVLALQRAGTLAAAARQLGVDATTVSRRLRTLEAQLGTTLFQRHGDAAVRLTTKGEAIAVHAAAAEHHFGLIDQDLVEDPLGHAGTVRLTSVPILVNCVLIPNANPLLAQHPSLTLELIPDSRDFSLTRREADLALRFGRPKTGGNQVKARRIADMPYGVYAASHTPAHEHQALPWITYDDAMAHLPQAKWMTAAVRRAGQRVSALRVHDGGSALEAAASGQGKTLVPVAIGDANKRLVRLDDAPTPPLLRELWLLGHEDQMNLGRIKAVVDWLGGVFRAGQRPEKTVE